MENDSIVVTAKLNVDASEALILRDLEKIQGDLEKNPLKINCVISDATLKNIQSQISSIANSININVDTTGINAVHQSMQQTTSVVSDVNQQVQQLSNSLANLSKRYTELIDDRKLVSVFDKATNTVDEKKTIEAIHKLYSELGEVETKVHTIGTRFNDVDVRIKSTTGEIRTLNLALKDISKPLEGFNVTGTTLSDSGVRKQTEEISKFVDTYTAKLNSLRASVGESFAPNISATIGEGAEKVSVTFDSLKEKLASLASGTGSVEEIRAEFTALDGVVKDLNSELGKSQGKGFNRFDNAEISAREFDNTLAKIKADISGLNDANPKLANLSKQFETLKTDITNLSQGTRNAEWIQEYTQISIKLREIQNEITLVKKLESQDNSSATQKQLDALRELKAAYSEIKSLTSKAGVSGAGENYKAELERQISAQNETINSTIKRLQDEKLLTQEIKNQIQLYELAYSNRTALAQSRQQDMEITKQETELAKQKEAYEERQHIYWQTKFEDSIKGLTAENEELKKMRQYYQDLEKAAQKEEALYAKQLEAHQREIIKNLDLKEKEIQKARELNEVEMGNYWQGRFEESVKGMTAENEELKKMRQYYADLENVAQTSLGTIKSSYEKIVSLNAKLTSGKLSETEANSIRKQIEEQEVLAIKARQKLETEGLYTEEIAKQINGIKSQAEAIINARNQQKVSNEELAKSINTYEDGLTAIHNAYKAIADATKTLYSNKSTDVRKSYALADIAVQRDLLSTIQERLATQGLIDDAINEEIKKGEILVTRTQQIAQSEAQKAQATRDERDAERELTEQARQHNKELKETESYINNTVTALEKFNNSAVAKNNASNPAVASQTGLNADLINQLRGLQESLANDKSPENVARITARLNELGGSLKDATARSAELNQSLKDNDASAKFSAKLNNLKNQVDIFANTNRRATESLKQMRNGMTFAEEWQRIVSQLKSGNLDENAIRRLSEDLRNFKGEAQSAGLTVNRFFQSMGSQLKMVMQRWVSLYAIIGRITSAFNELKSVDKILTEIAKSSDVTRESLESLGNAAFDMANKYGRSVTDYLYGVQEFSRAGFRGDQLTGLTQVSLLAQSAGDIETDLANSYVIATNAAYGLAGSQEKLGEVLD